MDIENTGESRGKKGNVGALEVACTKMFKLHTFIQS